MASGVARTSPDSPLAAHTGVQAQRTAQKWARRVPLLPALLIAISLTQLPFLLTVYYSLHSWNILRPASWKFVGLDNYIAVFSDSGFRTAAINTVTMTASAVIFSMVAGVTFALLLDRSFLGRSVVRTMLITPFLVMPAAAALLWKTSMLHPVFGLVNFVLSPFGGGSVDWASRFPMTAIVVVLVWQWTPFMMLIVLAGLQSQSPEVIEAARVDGAGPWMTFWHVTLPHLRQYIELGILLGSIYLVQTFDAIFLITQGGPGRATTNLQYFLYLQGFRAFDIGEAAALGVIVVLLTIIVANFALRVISGLFKAEGSQS